MKGYRTRFAPFNIDLILKKEISFETGQNKLGKREI
jgi:hypothetical protein